MRTVQGSYTAGAHIVNRSYTLFKILAMLALASPTCYPLMRSYELTPESSNLQNLDRLEARGQMHSWAGFDFHKSKPIDGLYSATFRLQKPELSNEIYDLKLEGDAEPNQDVRAPCQDLAGVDGDFVGPLRVDD